MLPALSRLPDPITLIAQEQYFVLHAARQTGKGTAMTTAAAIDRVVHHAIILELTGSSYRADAAKNHNEEDNNPQQPHQHDTETINPTREI